MTDQDIAVKAAEKVLEECTPDKMSRLEASDFLVDVIDFLNGSLDALHGEMKDE